MNFPESGNAVRSVPTRRRWTTANNDGPSAAAVSSTSLWSASSAARHRKWDRRRSPAAVHIDGGQFIIPKIFV
jgi:hypothetical protein